MAKKLLTGTLEEQCSFLYQLAHEKMASGNYTGAVYALKEIVRYRPDYADASRLLAVAREEKRKQRNRIVISLVGAIVAIGIGSMIGVRNDLWLFAMAFVGLLVGYGAANLIRGQAAAS